MENPKIEWITISGQKCLKFTFAEKLNGLDAREAVDKWKKYCDSASGNKIILIWDCLEMQGYDPEARNVWQNALKDLKTKIENIFVITNSSLIKMGTMAMSMFASYKMKVVGSIDEIKL